MLNNVKFVNCNHALYKEKGKKPKKRQGRADSGARVSLENPHYFSNEANNSSMLLIEAEEGKAEQLESGTTNWLSSKIFATGMNEAGRTVS